MDPRTVSQIHSLHAAGKGQRSIAKELGLNCEQVRYYLNLRQTRARVSSTGIESATYVPDAPVQEAILEWAKAHVKPLPALRKPRSGSGMLVFGLYDCHLGAYAWDEETGNNWDINIAATRVNNAVDDIIADVSRYGSFEQVVLPIGSDFLHYDGIDRRTSRGDHDLDTDTRFRKVYATAISCTARLIEMAVRIGKRVKVLYIPGNHDALTSHTLVFAMQQRFLKTKQVEFDLRACSRKYLTYGHVLLGFDHGLLPVNKYPGLMAQEMRQAWGNATWKEWLIGHTHQRKERMFWAAQPFDGVLVRTLPSLAAVDAWHYSKGFIGDSQKSAEAIRYDKNGLRGTHVAFARDI